MKKVYMHFLLYVFLLMTNVACGQVNNSSYERLRDKNKVAKTDTPSVQHTENDYQKLGDKYSAAGAFSKAVEAYSLAIQVNPDFLSAYIERALCYQKMSYYTKAVKDLKLVIEKDKEHSIAYNNLGNVYYEMGAPLKAIKSFNKTIELSPNYNKAYYNRGYVYNDLGKKAKACADWKKATSLGHIKAPEMLAKYCK